MSNYYYIEEARKAERESNWVRAAQCWRAVLEYEHANACDILAESRRRGDEYRESLREYHEAFESGLITEKEYHNQIDIKYREHQKK